MRFFRLDGAGRLQAIPHLGNARKMSTDPSARLGMRQPILPPTPVCLIVNDLQPVVEGLLGIDWAVFSEEAGVMKRTRWTGPWAGSFDVDEADEFDRDASIGGRAELGSDQEDGVRLARSRASRKKNRSISTSAGWGWRRLATPLTFHHV